MKTIKKMNRMVARLIVRIRRLKVKLVLENK